MKNVHRSIAFGLATFLLAIAFPASALQDPTYVGTTAQGEPIEFDVERRDVLTLTRIETITTQVCDDGATFHDHRTVFSWPVVKEGVPLHYRLLSMHEEDERTTVAITGHFDNLTASGDMDVKYRNGSATCRSGQVFWTAERVRTTATGWLYRGTTSQSGRPIRFRIERQERALVLNAYSVSTTEACDDGTDLSHSHIVGLAGLVFEGRTLHLSEGDNNQNTRIDGKFLASAASGTLQTDTHEDDPDVGVPGRQCTTGELTWTAERVPRSPLAR